MDSKFELLSAFQIIDDSFVLPYRLYIPKTEKPVPLVIYLHGAGERGTDNKKQLTWGLDHLLNYAENNRLQFAILAPQCPPEYRWVETDWTLKQHQQPEMPSKPMSALIKLLSDLRFNKELDHSKWYGVGLSMGGFGIWDLITRKPEWFAAALPICGGVDLAQLHKVAHLPIWMFHGEKDTVVWPERSRSAFSALNKMGAQNVLYTEYPLVEHNSWSETFENQDVWNWLFNQSR
ncbi:phospholipase [bacterium]|nr:MAG: phospholipase [bacterium]